MNIGEASRATGISSKMIRHYESIGLTQPSARAESGYRTYSEADVHVLRFIKSARSLGFSLDQIKLLLSLWLDKQRASSEVKTLALQHIEALSKKITELTAMRSMLQSLADNCQGNERPDCPIIDGLSRAPGADEQAPP